MSLEENQWGYRATPPMVMCSWTKLLLDASTRPAANDDFRLMSQTNESRLRLPSHRDAQGVAADFLRELYVHLESRVVKNLGKKIFDSTPMDVWLTVPAVWSDQAQSATKNAAKEAGFGARPGDTISVISEPEAAAVAHLSNMSRPETMNKPSVSRCSPSYVQELTRQQIGENIMICDCGGGTVDITSYTIVELGQQPVFDEACVGIGMFRAGRLDCQR
jgi:molecular chaperone DnaK (HSP70)